MAWLKRQGVTGPIESLSPQDVIKLTAAAQKVILGKKEREKRALPRLEETAPPPPEDLSEELPKETHGQVSKDSRIAPLATACHTALGERGLWLAKFEANEGNLT